MAPGAPLPESSEPPARRLADLPTPALVLDLDRLERNIEAMAAKCRRLGVDLRPHVKTHKCPPIAALQTAAGARGITVATLQEARIFADAGFEDITWAFPVILSRLDEVRELASEVRLGLVADSPTAIDALEALDSPLSVYLKVDCGYHRAGVDPGEDSAVALARRLASSARLEFAGILSHAGHSYAAPGVERLAAVAEGERAVMAGFAERLRGDGVEVPVVSVGSTPGMSAVRDLTGIDEVRPGNYVFFDGIQVELGSCRVEECALTVLTSVVSRSSGHAIVDAGALALSKDAGLDRPGAAPRYGTAFADYDRGRLDPELHLTGLSQEHGRLSVPRPVGETIRILPRHSCLTAAQFDTYVLARGDKVVGLWPVERQRDPRPPAAS